MHTAHVVCSTHGKCDAMRFEQHQHKENSLLFVSCVCVCVCVVCTDKMNNWISATASVQENVHVVSVSIYTSRMAKHTDKHRKQNCWICCLRAICEWLCNIIII